MDILNSGDDSKEADDKLWINTEFSLMQDVEKPDQSKTSTVCVEEQPQKNQVIRILANPNNCNC